MTKDDGTELAMVKGRGFGHRSPRRTMATIAIRCPGCVPCALEFDDVFRDTYDQVITSDTDMLVEHPVAFWTLLSLKAGRFRTVERTPNPPRALV